MALSYQTYWDTCQYLEYPTTPSSSLPELMDMELQQSLSFDQNTPCLDSIFDHTPEDYNHLLIDTSPPLPELEPNTYQYSYPYLYPYQSLPESKPFLPEFQCQMSPVSQRSGSDCYVDFSATTEKLPEFRCQVPPVFSIGSGGGGGGSGTLSAQSVAARQRRRKIMERTQELGKLVPGGNKMNTAEMFGAAYKYIKFLQAQVGILQLLKSTQENEVAQLSHCEQLQNLATCTKIQEKLYSHEKCLVPNQFIDSISQDEKLQKSNPFITKEINQLIRKRG